MAAAPAFKIDDLVEVRDLGKSGHVRIPRYIRGHFGRVIQHCGIYLNPEDLAIGITSGPAVHLYRVAFSLRALWSDDSLPKGDQLIIEIYEHWLACASSDDYQSNEERKDKDAG